MSQPLRFLWHDYETFGADPRRDRPCQFAAVWTDAELNEVGEAEMFYCQPADDYLPQPDAVLITGITPQHARREGLTEAAFAQRIQALMSQPGTCTLGYNSLRFDDEVTRHLFYRNFIDPYAREWQQGNSRWDLIDLVRAVHALRPEGIEWPKREDGSTSFRLEDLTRANGITHGEAAHDALADVRATISLARLIRKAQPRLFDYVLQHRTKAAVSQWLQPALQTPLVHVSSRYPASQGCTTLVLPLVDHPSNPNAVLAYDLSQDPLAFFEGSVEQWKHQLFSTTETLAAEGLSRLPIKLIHKNRCPVLFPVKTMDSATAERLGLDLAAQERHWKTLLTPQGQQWSQRLPELFKDAPVAETDPDLMLYSGPFFSDQDKRQFEQLRQMDPLDLAEWVPVFNDPRLDEMLFRYRARNWPETLATHEMERWDEYRWQRMQSTRLASITLKQLEARLQALVSEGLNEQQLFLLGELQLHVESILPIQCMEGY